MCPRLQKLLLLDDSDSEGKSKQKDVTSSKWSSGKTFSLSKTSLLRSIKLKNNQKEDFQRKGLNALGGEGNLMNFQLETFWFSSLYALNAEAEQENQDESEFIDNNKEDNSKLDMGTTNLSEISQAKVQIKLVKNTKQNEDLPRKFTIQRTFLERPDEPTAIEKRESGKAPKLITIGPEKHEEVIEEADKQDFLSASKMARLITKKGGPNICKGILHCTADVETQTYAKMPEIKEIVLLSSKPVSQRIESLFNLLFQQLRDMSESPKLGSTSRSYKAEGAAMVEMKGEGSKHAFLNHSPSNLKVNYVRVMELLQLSPETVHNLFALKDLVEKNLATQSASSLSVIQHIFPEEFAEADNQVRIYLTDRAQLDIAKHQEPNLTPNLARTKTKGIFDGNEIVHPASPQAASVQPVLTDKQGASISLKPIISAIFNMLATYRQKGEEMTPDTRPAFEKKLSMAENSSLGSLVQPLHQMTAKVDAVTREVSNLLSLISEGITNDCATEDADQLLPLVLQPLLVDSISRCLYMFQQQGSQVKPSSTSYSAVGTVSWPNQNQALQNPAPSHLTPIFHSPFDVSNQSNSKQSLDKPIGQPVHSSSSQKVDFLQDDGWLKPDIQGQTNKEDTTKEGRVQNAGRPGSKVGENANKLAMIDLNKDVSSLISSRLSNRSNQVIVMMRWAINRSDSSLKYKLVELFLYFIAALLVAAKIVFLALAQSATSGLFDAQAAIKSVALSAHASAWLHKQSIKGLLQAKAFESEGVFYKVSSNGKRIFSPEFPAYILASLKTGQFELANNQFFQNTYILDYPSTNPLKPPKASALTLLFDTIFMYKQFQTYSGLDTMTPELNKKYMSLLIDINDETLGAFNILQIKLAELSDATSQNVDSLGQMTLLLFLTNISFCVIFIVSTRIMGYLQNEQLSQAVDLMNKVDKKYFLKAIDVIYSRSKKSSDGYESGGTIRRGDATRFTEFEGMDQWDADFQYRLRLTANIKEDDDIPVYTAKNAHKPYTVKVWEAKTLTSKENKLGPPDMPSTARELKQTERPEVLVSPRLDLELSPRVTIEADVTNRLMSPREHATIYFEPVAKKVSQSKRRSMDGYNKRSTKQAKIQDAGLKLNVLGLIAVALFLPTILEIVSYVGVNFNSVALAERVNLMRGARRTPDYILASITTSALREKGVDIYSSTDTSEKLVLNMIDLIDRVRLNQESDIQTLLNSVQTCDADMMLKAAKLVDMDTCFSAYNMGSDRRLKSGMDSVAIRLRGLRQEFRTKLLDVDQTRAASRILLDAGFWEIDMANFFTTIPWKAAIDTYLANVSDVIQNGMQNFIWYSVAFILGTAILLVIFRVWWLPVLLHDWVQLKHTFLMQNQDVLTNPYVSSFFGKGGMSILGGIQGGNSGKH